MFLTEPAPSPYDLHFRVGPFPVRVAPWFWLITVLMGINARDAISIALWVGVCFASILVHELGHALLMRYFGESARVVLYGMGGLAISDGWRFERGFGTRGRRKPWEQVAISFAGPGAGFVFAALVFVLVLALRGRVTFYLPTLADPSFWDVQLDNRRLLQLVRYLLFVNISWGLVNLLPIFPLDGGQIARSLFLLNDPARGARRALIVSIVVAAIVSFVGFGVWRDSYVGFLFAALAASNFQSLRGGW